ncbi:hypothetical protein QBC41DRAFT_323033 [Cercophora samala]|uniref:Uncharacterized protein n=1 Tax=Cercophora samala TaxID=330535 RepID=A0AA40DAJ5_9PEZI|nr:hypothetical protein QBC41DRAFT_323033 [Cercophora samala]
MLIRLRCSRLVVSAGLEKRTFVCRCRGLGGRFPGECGFEKVSRTSFFVSWHPQLSTRIQCGVVVVGVQETKKAPSPIGYLLLCSFRLIRPSVGTPCSMLRTWRGQGVSRLKPRASLAPSCTHDVRPSSRSSSDQTMKPFFWFAGFSSILLPNTAPCLVAIQTTLLSLVGYLGILHVTFYNLDDSAAWSHSVSLSRRFDPHSPGALLR